MKQSICLQWLACLVCAALAGVSVLAAPPLDAEGESGESTEVQKKSKPPAPFRWVNPLPPEKSPHVEHHTFVSPSMAVDVGYFLFLPPGYADRPEQRFPVVYYLHGGRPGSEAKSVKLAPFIHEAMTRGEVPPAIYVFVNGGPVSHYNMPDQPEAQGESVFVNELIPHIDATYRTIASREGRALEGFSQGGRGTARIIFKHPHLFCSAGPGGGGHETEKRISAENGRESDNLVFAPGDNTWDLAARYAARPGPKPHPRLLVFVGTEGFNYENNLAYMQHLELLGIPFEKLIVAGAPHSATIIYEKAGTQIMQFHAESFRLAQAVRRSLGR